MSDMRRDLNCYESTFLKKFGSLGLRCIGFICCRQRPCSSLLLSGLTAQGHRRNVIRQGHTFL